MATPSGIYRREVFILGLCLLLVLWLVPAQAQGSTELPAPTETTQTTLQGEPTCPTGMIAFQPQSNGTNDTMGGTFSDDYLIVNVVISGFDVEWTSNFGVDLFLVHGAGSTNVYSYVPEATSGSGTTPSLSTGLTQADLVRYQFCYDYELRVDVTAAGTFTRAYSWDLSKDSAATYTGFIGDPAIEHDYLVTVDQTVTDSLFVINGDITVYNDSPVQANNVAVSSVVSADSFDGPVTVLCPALTVAAKRDGTAGSMVCTYSQEVASADEAANTATATATTFGSASKTVQVLFGPPALMGYPTVHVTDNWAGELGAISGDMTFPYSRSFQCPADKAAYAYGVYFMPEVVNTANIVEVPGESDSATVNLTCYAPLVS